MRAHLPRSLWPFLAVYVAAAVYACGAEAQAIDFSPRLLRFGEPVEAQTHRVRLGQNHGNALGFAFRAESGWIRVTAWWSETQVRWWPVGTENGPNPGPGGADDIGIMALTIGPGLRVPLPAFTIGASLAAGGIATTCDFSDCGSSPLFGWLAGADADVCIPGKPGWWKVGAVMRACLRAGLDAVPPRQGRWTWIADRAGRDPTVPHDSEETWFTIMHLGLAFGLRF